MVLIFIQCHLKAPYAISGVYHYLLLTASILYISNVFEVRGQTQNEATTPYNSTIGPTTVDKRALYVRGSDFCNYRGTRFIKTGDILYMGGDDCTACTCNDDARTIRCSHRSCPQQFCKDKIRLDPSQCCQLCPYYVPVYNISMYNFKVVRGGTYRKYHLEFDVVLDINSDGTHVQGDRLWRLDVWTSEARDGSGEQFGKEQVLSEEQDSLDIERPQFFGGYQFNITKVHYPLKDTDICLTFELPYICVEFAKGHDPAPENPLLPFNVTGVESAEDDTRNPSHLLRCVQYPLCEVEEEYQHIWITPELKGCTPPEIPSIILRPRQRWFNYGQTVTMKCRRGYTLVGTNKLVCTTKNSWHRTLPECIEDEITTTQAPIPTTKEGPEVNLNNIEVVKIDNVLRINVDVNVNSELNSNTPLAVGTWASSNADGSGRRTGFTNQVVKLQKLAASKPIRPSSDSKKAQPSSNSTSTPISSESQFVETTMSPASSTSYENDGTTHPVGLSTRKPSYEANQTSTVDATQTAEYFDTQTNVYDSQFEKSTTNIADKSLSSTLIPTEHTTRPQQTSVESTMQMNPSITTKQPEEETKYDVSIPNLNFDIDTSNASCKDIRYVCAAINVGNVTFEPNGTLDRELVGCERFSECVDVPVYDVSVFGVGSVLAGDSNTIQITVQVNVNDHGRSQSQDILWRVSAWSSANATGNGDRIGFIKQVLNERQSSYDYTRPFTGSYEFQIDDVMFNLNTSNSSCDQNQYLCVSFGLSDILKYDNISNALPFIVYGAKAENDSTPVPENLVECRPFNSCNESILTTSQPTTEGQPTGCFAPFSVRSSIFYTEPDKRYYALFESVKIICQPGMVLHGRDTYVCLPNGWHGLEKTPECWLQGCVRPEVTKDMLISPDRNWYDVGEEVTIDCKEGMTLVGNQSITCGSDEKWHGQHPDCVPQGCKRPDLDQNTTTIEPNKEWYSYGETAYIQITCPTDKQLSSGYKHFVCTDNGTWYREIPHCVLTENQTMMQPTELKEVCVRPSIPNVSRFYPELGLYHCGQQVNVSCMAGFHIVGDETIICSETGDWYFDVPHCIQDVVENEETTVVPSHSLGETATPDTCRRPVSDDVSILIPDKPEYSVSESVSLDCISAYKIVGKKKMICGQNGTWKGTLGYCKFNQKGCKVPKISSGVRFHPHQKWYYHGQTLYVNCSENYQLIGEEELVCLDTGDWHRELPECKGRDYITTPLIFTLAVICLLLVAALIVLNCVQDDYKPNTPQPKLIHRNHRKRAAQLKRNSKFLESSPRPNEKKCNGMPIITKTPPLARIDML